uniref:Ribosomal protein S14 n=1 Tax=Romanomermis culicivorax TaxID=13658 RepID=A0A915IB40_ROMCU
MKEKRNTYKEKYKKHLSRVINRPRCISYRRGIKQSSIPPRNRIIESCAILPRPVLRCFSRLFRIK